MKVQKLKPVLLCFLISLLGSIVWSEFYLSQRNILAFKKDWHLHTLKYLNPNIVSAPVLTSPWLFQGYRLKSNIELGIVRILSDESLKPQSGKILFRLENGGFVDIIFNSTNHSFMMLRLSRLYYYPSGIIHSDSSGKILLFHPLNFTIAQGHHLLSFQDGSFTVGGKTYHHPELHFEEGQTGVQVSPENAEIAYLEVNNKVLTFIPEGPRLGLYGRHWLIIFILALIIGALPRAGILRAGTAILGLGSIVLLAELLIGINPPVSPQEIQNRFEFLDKWWVPGKETLKTKLKSIESGESSYVIFHCQKNGCTKNNLNIPLPEKKGQRILIFGGSQSKYALISDYSESVHFRFDEALRRKIPDIETINLSTPGLFHDRVRVYGSKLDFVRPDTIIIETMILDQERDTIRKFISEAQKRGIRIILLRAPQNLLKFGELTEEVAIPELKKGINSEQQDLPRSIHWVGLNNLDFIRKIQIEFNLIVLDPNELFLKEQLSNSGQLFWDSTHMTIFGQKTFGEWLAAEYVKLD